MHDTVHRYLNALSSERDRAALRPILDAGCNIDSSQTLTSAGLAIGGSTALAKTGAATTYLLANGTLVAIAGGTNMPALAGTVANGQFGVFCFYSDSGGNLYSYAGTPGATLGAVVFPPVPIGQALLGFVLVNPSGTGAFVGGTTALNDGTVVPNAVYIDIIGAFDATAIVQ